MCRRVVFPSCPVTQLIFYIFEYSVCVCAHVCVCAWACAFIWYVFFGRFFPSIFGTCVYKSNLRCVSFRSILLSFVSCISRVPFTVSQIICLIYMRKYEIIYNFIYASLKSSRRRENIQKMKPLCTAMLRSLFCILLLLSSCFKVLLFFHVCACFTR